LFQVGRLHHGSDFSAAQRLEKDRHNWGFWWIKEGRIFQIEKKGATVPESLINEYSRINAWSDLNG
jgi:hypothetical protein